MIKILFNKVMNTIFNVDERLFKGKFKAFHTRYIKYRGKAPVLTDDLYWPPHEAANKKVKSGHVAELLAVGGDLSPDRMIQAYKNGIFPLYYHDQPILWWTAESRCVLLPKEVHVSKKMQQVIKSNKFNLTIDQAFDEVIQACSELRKASTWLTPERLASCKQLHELGIAHSVEVWEDQKLVGGVYGVVFGSYVFCESMFSRVTNTSKLALIALAFRLKELNCAMIDCGMWPTEHLKSLGVVDIHRDAFLKILDQSTHSPDMTGNWGDLFANWDIRLALKNHLAQQRSNPLPASCEQDIETI